MLITTILGGDFLGLFLLGIPVAIIGAKILHDDIKYTSMDIKNPKGSQSLSQQYQQIDKNFVNIVDYSGAVCDIKKIGYEKYEIKNVKQGQYGGMERYLAEKGYYPQAIQYAKRKFDAIAEEEQKINNRKRNDRINAFERKLLTSKVQHKVIKNEICTISLPKKIVEKEIEKLINYFNSHNNSVQCNIIMDGSTPYCNHEEIWHINAPVGENVCQYYFDVCDKLDIKWKN